jgi:SAM-dependent methyltransferase
MRTTLIALLDDLSRSVPFEGPIYEFGSYRVPGQRHLPPLSSLFPGREFVACDLRPGPGVDRIEDLHDLSLPDASIATALLFDTIEHVRDPWRALAELHRCLRPGGVLVMSSVWFFPIHAYPDDYWRFTSSGFKVLLRDFHPIGVDMCGLRRMPHTVVGIASKGRIDLEREQAMAASLAEWKRRGSRSWKEVVLDGCPPFMLLPLYNAFLRAMQLLHRERPTALDEWSALEPEERARTVAAEQPPNAALVPRRMKDRAE